jgi:hypothetical protein
MWVSICTLHLHALIKAHPAPKLIFATCLCVQEG